MTFSDPENPLPPDSASPPISSPPTGVPQFPVQAAVENFPEDIRTPWGGGELLLLLGFAIGSLLVMDVILQLFLIAHYHMDLQQLREFVKTNAAFAVGFQAVWSAVIFLFLFLMIRAYHGAPFWSSLRWRLVRPRTSPAGVVYLLCIFGGVALATGISAISNFVGTKNNLPIEEFFHTRADVIWLMAFGICVAPFFEETVFRGYLYPVFARKWGVPAGIFITGLLFGLVHAAQLWGGLPQIALLIFVGIVLTFARARSGSVLASYLVHLSYNSFLFAGFFLSTHGLKNIPPLH